MHYHVVLDSNGRSQMATSDVTWSQKSTLVYTLNPELMRRSVITDVQITVVHILLVMINLEFAFILTIFDIFYVDF